MTIIIVAAALTPTRAATSQDEVVEEEVVLEEPKVVQIEVVYTKERLKELAHEIAVEHGVSPQVMKNVVTCENDTWDPKRQSELLYSFTDSSRNIYIGELERSFGLAQIHLPDHPTISKAEATDPIFALTFMAKNLAKGKGSMWTCYRKIYG